jgi:hypothetical protein
MNIYDLIGMIGAVAFLGSYGILQLGTIKSNGVMYSFCNLIGAVAILISISQHLNFAVVFIQIVWGILGTMGLLKAILKIKSTAVFSAEGATTSQEFIK